MYLSYYVFICSLSYFPLVNVVATAERPAKYIYIYIFNGSKKIGLGEILLGVEI